jgi:YjbE family integral membrane protein
MLWPTFFTTFSWYAVLQIVMIDILLGGDNAVVIALACRNLPAAQRVRGVLWGTAGAIVLRIVLTGFAVELLHMPLLKLVGGLLLLWIGVKLIVPAQENDEASVKSSGRLLDAVRTIIIADALMSLDNVIAIAGAAEAADPQHRFALVTFGLIVSIPLVVWGSQLVLRLLDRFPVIVTLGGALLGWIAGGLMMHDPLAGRWPQTATPLAGYAASVIGALFVVALGYGLKRRKERRAP